MSVDYPQPSPGESLRGERPRARWRAEKPQRGDVQFAKVTRAQLAVHPIPRGELPDGDHLSSIETKFLIVLSLESLAGQKPCRLSNVELAERLGSESSAKAKEKAIQHLLYGRPYRKYNPETGKRDGERGHRPGLIERGWTHALNGTSLKRGLLPSAKWLGHAVDALEDLEAPAVAGQVLDATTAKLDALEDLEAPSDDVAGPEDLEPAPTAVAKPEALEDLEPATIARPVPTSETLKTVFGRHWQASRRELASKLLDNLRSNESIVFRLAATGSIEQIPHAAGVKPDGDHQEALDWLEPELVELLKPRPAAAATMPGKPAAGPSPTPGKHAPPALCLKDVRRGVEALRSDPAADDSDCRKLARRVVTDPGFAPGESDPRTSEETYFGILRDTKLGKIPPSVFLESLEVACGPKIQRRGKMLVSAITQRLADWKSRSGSREGTS